MTPIRVAIVCAALPTDVTHLEVLAEQIELTVLHSSRLAAGISRSTRPPDGAAVRTLAPLLPTSRPLGFVFRGLRRALDEARPDVVHVVSEPWGLLAVQAAAWARTRPAARLALHGCDTIWHHGGRAEQLARRALLRYTLPRTDAWVAESQKALSLAAAHGLPSTSRRRRIHTNPRDGRTFRPPTAADRARSRAALGLAADVTAVGLIGRLVPEKGVQPFLEAAELLLGTGRRIRFFVAGEGPMRDEVVGRTSKDLVYLGRLPHPDGVLDLLHALDVLVCPSLTTASWEDQGPRSLIEAMMCGVIPVGTPTGAIAETLGGQGVLTASTRAEALVEAVDAATRLAAAPHMRVRVAEAAADTYSSQAAAGQLLELWSQLSTHPPRREAKSGPVR